MSYTSDSHLAPNSKIKDVNAFLTLLGYKAVSSWKAEELGKIYEFYWFEEEDYRSTSGVQASVYEAESVVRVTTGTPIARSYYDLKHQNQTIRELRNRFGGWFTTDAGKNRCWPDQGTPPTPSKSGCARAYNRYGRNTIKASIYLMGRDFKNYKKSTSKIEWIDEHNPWLISNNLLLPFLVSASEDYWKSTYVALLKYSEKKESILKSAHFSGNQLVQLSKKKITVEELFAESLSFQSISSICNNFAKLGLSVDLAAILKKPLRKGSKQSFYLILESLTEMRHRLIHRGELNDGLSETELQKMIKIQKQAIKNFHLALFKANKWTHDPLWID